MTIFLLQVKEKEEKRITRNKQTNKKKKKKKLLKNYQISKKLLPNFLNIYIWTFIESSMFHSSHKLLKSVEKNSLTLSLKNFAQIWAKFKDILKSNHR